MSGYVDVSIYVILSAIGLVFIDGLCTQLHPVTALFFMSGVALLFFNLLILKQIKQTYLACYQYKMSFLVMSFALGVDWVGIIYGTYLSDPFITMAALFITLAFLGFATQQKTEPHFSNLCSMFLLLACIVLLDFTYQMKLSHHTLYGLLLGGISGVGFFLYIVFSGRFSNQGQLSSKQVLATRFWALFIGAFFMMPKATIHPAITTNFPALLFISFIALIIPVFFNQQAINKLGSARTAIFISFVPPATFLFDAIHNHHFIFANFTICMLISLALIFPKLIAFKASPRPIT